MSSLRSSLSLLLAAAAALAFAAPGHLQAAQSASPFITTGTLNTSLGAATATLLGNGKVLVAGGVSVGNIFASAELYDPATGIWMTTGTLGTPRYDHTATLLPDGKVLVVGGFSYNGPVASAELYDPASGTWSPAGSLATAVMSHTATLLPNGKVLVAGGDTGDTPTPIANAELYDPASGIWTTTSPLGTARYDHTATLLPDGKVLVAAGFAGESGDLASAEIYDPASGTWSATGSLTTTRYDHTATLLPNGTVLVAGGLTGLATILASAELYDPATGIWTATGSLVTARFEPTATLLANGKVLVAGGGATGSDPLASAELYDPSVGTWSNAGSLTTPREEHTATLLPNAKVLFVGGFNGDNALNSSELYEVPNGGWSTTGSLNSARYEHTASLLSTGAVLVAGGTPNDGETVFSSAELYDPVGLTWSLTGTMNNGRAQHTSTLLPGGKVLVAAGIGQGIGAFSSAELYDPVAGTWSLTGTLNNARAQHTATLLQNGKVLVAGGYFDNPIDTAELYDPSSGTWSFTGSLNHARSGHTATMLPNGQVLVVGGYFGGYLSTAELYDPVAGTWTDTGSLNAARTGHTATLLPNGSVLVAGGFSEGINGLVTTTAEIYDPVAGKWSFTGSLGTARDSHTATLLRNGKVLVAGGNGGSGDAISSSELYDPGLGTWTPTGSLVAARDQHTATLLPDGTVLAAGGGSGAGDDLSSAEVYNLNLDFLEAWQPKIATITSPVALTTGSLALTGTVFTGVSGASAGLTYDSSTNYPVLQLLSLDNEQTVFLPSSPGTNWSDTALTSVAVTGMPPGYALATVFTNGIPSESAIILIATEVSPLTLAPVSITSSNPNPSYAKAGDTVTLSFTANEPIQTPTVTIAGLSGTSVTVTNTSGNSWTAAIVVTGSCPQGPAAFEIDAQAASDGVGTGLVKAIDGGSVTTVTQTTDSSSVIIDTVNPTVDASGVPTTGYTVHATLPDLTGDVEASDTNGISSLVQSPEPGTVIEGNETVTFTATDPAGNSFSASVAITATVATADVTVRAYKGEQKVNDPEGVVYTGFFTPETGAYLSKVSKTPPGAEGGGGVIKVGGLLDNFPDAVIISITQPSGNALLATFRVGVGGITAKNNVALLVGDLADADVDAPAQTGIVIPGLPEGVTLKKFFAIDGDEFGADPYFFANLQGAGVTAANSLALCSVPSGNDVFINDFRPLDIAGSEVNVLVRKGDSVPVNETPKTVLIVTSLVGSPGTLADGRWRMTLPDFGEETTVHKLVDSFQDIGVRLTFTDKSEAIFAIPSTAGGTGDWLFLVQTGLVSSIDGLDGTTITSFGLPGFGDDAFAVLANLAVGPVAAPNLKSQVRPQAQEVVTKANNIALITGDGEGDPVVLLARKGDVVATDANGNLLVGVTITGFGDPIVGADGAVACMVTMADAPLSATRTTDGGLKNKTATAPLSYKTTAGIMYAPGDGGELTLLANNGAPAPGGGHWASFSSLVLPINSQYGPIFVGKLAISAADGITAKNNTRIWGMDTFGDLILLFQTGQIVTVNDVPKTVKSFVALAAAPGSVGAVSGYDVNGNVAVVATFTDGTTALLNLAIPQSEK